MDDEKEILAPDGDAPKEARAIEEYNAALDEFLGDDQAPANMAAVQDHAEEQDESAVGDPAPAGDAADSDGSADGNASPAETPNDDIWANAPPELREAHEREKRDAELRFRSSQGRLTAMQRQIEALSQQSQPGRGDQGAEPRQNQDGADPKVDDELAKLEEEYPEIAGPLAKMIRSQAETINRLQQGYSAFEQQQAEAYYLHQQQQLESAHPDWLQTAQDPRFEGWLMEQPNSIREAMKRNFNAIVDGRDAALVIGSFKRDMGIGVASPAATPPSPTPDPAISDKRQRQLASGRDAGRNGAPIRTGLPPKDDHDASLDYFLAQQG